jgi:hypothetical protein
MPDQKIIPAKPTTYKGITYRSRLEASWAVFFDNFFNAWMSNKDLVGNVVTIKCIYEPFSNCPDTAAAYRKAVGSMGALPGYSKDDMNDVVSYTPDFLVVFSMSNGDRVESWYEIKPKPVSSEYVKKLRGSAWYAGLVDISLTLLVGSFRGDDGILVSYHPYVVNAGTILSEFSPDRTLDKEVEDAYKVARNYRWDLK